MTFYIFSFISNNELINTVLLMHLNVLKFERKGLITFKRKRIV